MSREIPFVISKRPDSKFFQVRFRDFETGRLLTARSTKKTTEKEAESVAWDWYRSGKIKTDSEKKESIDDLQLRNFIKKAEITDEQLNIILEELEKRKIIRSYVLNDDSSNISALDYCLDFWDAEKSVYAREKERKGQRITLKHLSDQRRNIELYWKEFLKNKVLGEITRKNLEAEFERIGNLKFSAHTKNIIIRALFTPLRYAFNHEIVEKDLTTGWIFFSEKYKERGILTKEQAKALFSVDWHNPIAKLANILSMCTGMRQGEILALRLQDLGENVIYLRHSWNTKEGLKAPKNNHSRIVSIPFPWITEALKELAYRNPFCDTMEAFIFWSAAGNKPMDGKIFIKELRRQLDYIGINDSSICFHSWRHFFTAYMIGSVDNGTLQKQTGHLTESMLLHYADHETATRRNALMEAQKEMFSEFLEVSERIAFTDDVYSEIGKHGSIDQKTFERIDFLKNERTV